MGNSLRCCLACALPCGALDVVRIVHMNGQVEEFSRQVSAGEILAANPDHVISKPCLQGTSTARRTLIVSSDCELKRGRIYFLIPVTSLPETKIRVSKKKQYQDTACRAGVKSGRLEKESSLKSSHRRRRSSRVAAVWRPHLESIVEDV